MMKLPQLAVLGCALTILFVGRAQLVIHTPSDATATGVTLSPPFASLTPGGEVGSSLIAFGVDYTFGNIEGIFDDPPLAFAGINGLGKLDLLSGIDGRIVMLNTFNAGFTDYVSIVAGNSAPGTLLLSVFDSSLNLISSTLNLSFDLSTMTIDRSGIFDIAYFSVTTPGADSFGVQSVTINTPVTAEVNTPAQAFVPVPEPSTYGLMGGLLLGAAIFFRRRAKR